MAKPIQYTVSDGKLVLTLEVAEEGGYVVTSPLNPDVLTQAESLEEAFAMAREVIALFEEDRAELKGRKMAKPITYTVSDGKLVLTLEVAEEGGFTVTSAFIPGLVTEAETLEEAFDMARDALESLKAARLKKRRRAAVATR